MLFSAAQYFFIKAMVNHKREAKPKEERQGMERKGREIATRSLTHFSWGLSAGLLRKIFDNENQGLVRYDEKLNEL